MMRVLSKSTHGTILLLVGICLIQSVDATSLQSPWMPTIDSDTNQLVLVNPEIPSEWIFAKHIKWGYNFGTSSYMAERILNGDYPKTYNLRRLTPEQYQSIDNPTEARVTNSGDYDDSAQYSTMNNSWVYVFARGVSFRFKLGDYVHDKYNNRVGIVTKVKRTLNEDLTKKTGESYKIKFTHRTTEAAYATRFTKHYTLKNRLNDRTPDGNWRFELINHKKASTLAALGEGQRDFEYVDLAPLIKKCNFKLGDYVEDKKNHRVGRVTKVEKSLDADLKNITYEAYKIKFTEPSHADAVKHTKHYTLKKRLTDKVDGEPRFAVIEKEKFEFYQSTFGTTRVWTR